jgi:hypothetical protein
MDQDELDLERRKLEHEERRVRVEERKADQGRWTRLGVVVPLIAAVIAFASSVYSENQKRDEQIQQA